MTTLYTLESIFKIEIPRKNSKTIEITPIDPREAELSQKPSLKKIINYPRGNKKAQNQKTQRIKNGHKENRKS